MSLLLDSLKKAALEKQKRDQQGSDSPDPFEPNDKPSADEDSSVKPIEDTPLSLEIQEDSHREDEKPNLEPNQAEPNQSEPENTEPTIENTGDFGDPVEMTEEVTSGSSSLYQVEGEFEQALDLESDLELQLELNEAPEQDESTPLTSNEDSLTEAPLAEVNTQQDEVKNNTDVDSEPNNAESSEHTTPSASTTTQTEPTTQTASTTSSPSDKVSPQATLEENKEAINQLLTSGRSTVKRQRTRNFIGLFSLFLIALLCVGLYYSYILTDSTSQFFIPGVTSQELGQNHSSDLEQETDTTPDSENTPATTSSESLHVSPAETEAKPPPTPSTTPIKKGSIQKTATTTKRVTPKAAPKTTSNRTPRIIAKKKVSAKKPITIKSNTPTSTPLSRAIHQGFQAYQRGDFSTARIAYDAALQISPQHKDALLGAAAVAIRQNRVDHALRWYQQRLHSAPNDNHAKAGMLALVATSTPDPKLQSEVNLLLLEYPGAAHLHFLKGSINALHLQWGSAQLAFFEATRLERGNPNYLYNLAISLDHLGHPKEALFYYQQALDRIHKQSNFNGAALRVRIQQLQDAQQ